MKTQIIGGIIILIVAGLFARYKIFDDKIELKYSLSEKIPSDFLDSIGESGIQQLTLKNSGDIMISSIVIKIKAVVQDFSIKKFKYTDSISTSKTSNQLEILYPELSPKGDIIILLKSKGEGILKGNIEIYHSKGIATEAFSNSKSYGSLVFISLFFLYLIFVLGGLRNALTYSFQSKAKYSPYDLLKKKKPWYIQTDKWSIIRKDSISNYIAKDNIYTIEKSDTYQILCAEKKEFLSEDEWNELIEIAENKLQTVITQKIYKSYYDQSFDELSTLKQPKNIKHEKWKIIQEEVSNAFCNHKFKDVFHYGNQQTIIKILSNPKPNIVTDDDWDKLEIVLFNFYSSLIIKTGISRYNYENFIEGANLEILDDESKKQIKEIFYRLNESVKSEKYNRLLLSTLREMFFWDNLQEKPDLLDDFDWEKISDIYFKVIEINNNIKEELSEVQEIKMDYFPLKEKVERQLTVIDNLLKDPSSIDKVEVYNNPFEKGNWDNLKKLSVILKNK